MDLIKYFFKVSRKASSNSLENSIVVSEMPLQIAQKILLWCQKELKLYDVSVSYASEETWK